MAEQDHLDLIWGAEAIAKAVGMTKRQVFWMLESGQLPGARKVGRKWVISRKLLREYFEGAAA